MRALLTRCKTSRIPLLVTGMLAAALFGAYAVFGGLVDSPIVKLNPATVIRDSSGVWVEDPACWKLFDRDTTTGYDPATSSGRVLVTFPAATDISSLKVYGSASYYLTVYDGSTGSWISVPGLNAVSLVSQGVAWNTFTPTSALHTDRLMLEFTDAGGTANSVKEIEIWGADPGDAALTLKGAQNAADVSSVLATSPLPGHILVLDALPQSVDVPADGDARSFSFTLGPDPRLIRRAWLLYSSYNADYPVSVEKRINGGSWSGGFVTPASETPEWVPQAEELSPSWITRGTNTIDFRNRNAERDPSSYFIKDLKVVVEMENGWNLVSAASSTPENVEHPVSAVLDGNLTTYYLLSSAHTLDLALERMAQPDKIRVNFWSASGTLPGSLVLQYLQNGQWKDFSSGGTIDMSGLRKGWNEIKVPSNVATDGLRLNISVKPDRRRPGVAVGGICEIQVIASPLGTPASQGLVVNYPRKGEYFGRTAFIQGFVDPPANASGSAQIDVEGKTISNLDGSFSLSLSKDETSYSSQNDSEPWQAIVTAAYPDTSKISRTVPLTKDLLNNDPTDSSDSDTASSSGRKKFSDKIIPGQAKKIQYQGVTLDIPADAVDKETEITIIPLQETDLARLNPGMINVTYPAAGYRFLPHGMKFKKPINISFKYSRTLFATGQVDDQVNMYYYDEALLRWQQLSRIKVDPAASEVTSSSNHFTDIINSTIVIPEHPEALNFNPNSIKDIKAADPGANIDLIEPPKANSKGTANLSYPIDVPPGRRGLQPSIAIRYDSSAGNGWLGLGWNIPMQMITIDTRWGVPRYSSTYETETYLLDGEQLAPLAHRGDLKLRTDGTTKLPSQEVVKIFHPRVEGRFSRIVRHGTAPNNYWWEVIDKEGTRYFYGGKPDQATNIPDSQATLAGQHSDNIFKWALREVRDTNGNTITYSYQTVSDVGLSLGGINGQQIYLKEIDYTGHNDTPGAYSVIFIRDRELPNFVRRNDVMIDARSGFKMVTADLLKTIEVHYKDSQGHDNLVRSYSLDYKEGVFKKQLLASISQYGANGTLFYKHDFSYYDTVRNEDGIYNGFDGAVDWDTVPDDVTQKIHAHGVDASALGGSFATNGGSIMYVGFSLVNTKLISGGFKSGFNITDSETLLAMVDINGDGLPDKVYKKENSSVYYRLNTSGPHAVLSNVTFGGEHPLVGITELSHENAAKFSFGGQNYVAGFNMINDAGFSVELQSAYFADVNGDGLVDLVTDGGVFFNHYDPATGTQVFSRTSAGTPMPIEIGSVNVDGMLPDFSQRYEEMIDNSPLLDAVRRWVAPYDGIITITGDAVLNQDMSDQRLQYKTADGVRISVQKEGAELWSDTIDATDYNAHVPTGLSNIPVKRGDRIYFRVQSRFDGMFDQVQWNPEITYDGEPVDQTNVNGLPVYRFNSGDDLVYGGREFPIAVPFRGTLRITGNLYKKGITTDDVSLVVYLNDKVVKRSTLSWDQTGTLSPLDGDLEVEAKDVLKLMVEVDSNIDLKQLEDENGNPWQPRIFYVEAYYPDVTPKDSKGEPILDADGNPLGSMAGLPVIVTDDQGNYLIQLKSLYDEEFYPADNLSVPQQSWTAPETGTLLVTPNVTLKSLSGGTTFSYPAVFTVKRRGALLGKNALTIDSETPINPTLHSYEVAVTAGDELFFDFSTRKAALPDVIQDTGATIHYINPSNPIIVQNAPLVLSSDPTPTAPLITAATVTATATITPSFVLQSGATRDADSGVTLHVVRYHDTGSGSPQTVDYQRPITIQNGSSINAAAYAFDIPVGAGDQLAFYYTTADTALAEEPISGGAVVRITSGSTITDVPAVLHSSTTPRAFSRPYRGWGYVAYNGNRERADQPIDQGLLNLSSATADYNITNLNQVSNQSLKAYMALPDALNKRWASADEQWWISGEQMSSTRLGEKHPSVPNAGDINAMGGVPKISMSGQIALGGGFYVTLSGLVSPTDVILDYMDMNGDGFPDVVGNDASPSDTFASFVDGDGNGIPDVVPGNNTVKNTRIQYTGMNGTLEPASTVSIGAIRSSWSEGKMLSGGGTIGGSKDESHKENTGGQRSQSPSYGLGGSLGNTSSTIKTEMMDINGDGLPDRLVQSDDGKLFVELNVGYGFNPAELWGVAKLDDTTAFNASVSFSYNDGVKGWAGGANVNSTKTKKIASLVDINGDGLVDQVYKNGADLWVGFNTGAGFASPVLWYGALEYAALNSGSNTSMFGGGSYSYAIGPMCIIGCYLILNGEINFGASVSRVESILRDVNGDGYADHLFSTQDGTMKVAINRIDRTNLLETVTRPLGGKIEIKYERTGNTTDMPQSEWTMSNATLTDGKGNSYVNSFAYGNGYRDRYEREFYGFDKVITTQEPRTSAERTITQTFNNNDYYRRGLLLASVTTDKDGNVWAKNSDSYTLASVAAPTGNVNLDDVYFPQLTETDAYFYTGTSTDEAGFMKSTSQLFSYDAYGNIVQFIDQGEPGTDDDLYANIDYWIIDSPDAYFSKPNHIKITGQSPSDVYRERKADYDGSTGNLTKITMYISGSGSDPAVWSMLYDEYGNIWTITYPPGDSNFNVEKNDPYTVTYTYDPELSTHIAGITDKFGYQSTAGYNYRYGLPGWTRDINGHYQVNEYDEFGRMTAVYGPYAVDNGGTPVCAPTIGFEYSVPTNMVDGKAVSEFPAAALTTNRADSSQGCTSSTIRTGTFSDGMKRIIQTRKDADVDGAPTVVVSGRIVFDSLGRVVKQGQPMTGSNFAYKDIALEYPTLFTYDTLDRTTLVQTPDDGAQGGYAPTRTNYGFGNNLFLTQVVDPLRRSKESYKDVHDRIRIVVEHNKSAGFTDITTNYVYDPIGEITDVYDARGNHTTVGYDLLGRRLSINNPDTGLTTYTYDKNSNVTTKTTANLRNNGHNINYIYDYNRLVTIDYPDSTDVTYAYGSPSEAGDTNGNIAGRIKQVTDESGYELRYYGRLGETTKELRQINAKNNPINRILFETDYVFDSFGRMLQMTYPDGEVLYYHYGSGGLLADAYGIKRGNQYDYIKTLRYNKFEQRKKIVYGNNVVTDYGYDLKTLRLATLTTTLPGGRLIQNNTYTDNTVGNIIDIVNNAPVPTGGNIGGPTQHHYNYDDLDQLDFANGYHIATGGKETSYSNEFHYDIIGNIRWKHQTHDIIGTNGSQQPAATNYDLVYQYTGIHPHAVTDAGDKLYTYDADGNMLGWTSKTTNANRIITWNEENRVKNIADSGNGTDFVYDDSGERVIKRGGGNETVYVNRFYAVKNGDLGTKHIFAGNTRVTTKLERDGGSIQSGVPGLQGQALNHIIFAYSQGGTVNPPPKIGIARRLPPSLGGTAGTTTGTNPPIEQFEYFYHGDHLGSSNFITDDKGAVYEDIEYFPYGETWVDDGGNTSKIGVYLFTGKEFDPETGLYYYGARYYDSVLSRWISADPVLGKYLDGSLNQGVFKPLHLALYAYSVNAPVVFLDPDGETAFKLFSVSGRNVYFVVNSSTVSFSSISEFRNNHGIGDRHQVYDSEIVDESSRYSNVTPDEIKALMLSESGGNNKKSKAAFKTDPMQVLIPGDYDKSKGKYLNIKKHEIATPEKSIEKGVKWYSFKKDSDYQSRLKNRDIPATSRQGRLLRDPKTSKDPMRGFMGYKGWLQKQVSGAENAEKYYENR